MYRVGIIGASGAVGQEIMQLLTERSFPVNQLRCFASHRSVGKTVLFQEQKLPLEVLDFSALNALDIAFFCAGSAVSKEWIPRTQCTVIDSSSAFRTQAPLVIPEINAHILNTSNAKVIASPNCATTILLMPLFLLHRHFQIKRIVTSTYQAASGAGSYLMEELQQETRAFLEKRSHPSVLPFPYAFNLYPHNSALFASGYVEEEVKMCKETQIILEDPTIRISATCVRVPVLRAHSLSANVEFHRPFSLDAVYEIVRNTPGVALFENREQNRFPTPRDATGKNAIYCGRFRVDTTQPNTLEFWAVGDQLRKGAALNAVQIAEHLAAMQMEQMS